MMIHNYHSKNELGFKNEEDAMKVASILLNNFYVVMLSKEENLTIVNYEYSHLSDRNDVIFRSLEEWEWEEYNKEKEEDEDEYYSN